MAIHSEVDTSLRGAATFRPDGSEHATDRQMIRWGAVAALAGVISMLVAVGFVISLGLPDASDVESLTDFADIDSGRLGENIFYLGAVVLFALHALVLQRVLSVAHPAASLFGSTLTLIGLAIMAASALLHVSTSPLADLYSSPDTPSEDLVAIESAWHGAQSVFDAMLATGLVLVPIGILLLGVAMRASAAFGPRLTFAALGIGVLGTLGALIEIVDPGSDASAVTVLGIVLFNLISGWYMFTMARTVRSTRDA